MINTVSASGKTVNRGPSFGAPLSPVKRSKKHRRQRKSKIQRDALWGLFKKLEGRPPKRSQILELASNLNLKEQQIYKWFWDTKKKVEEDEQFAHEMGQDISYIFDEQGAQTVR